MWQEKVNGVLAAKGMVRVNGRVASERTQNITKAVVYASFRRLHQLGYKIEDPKNLGERHIEVLVKDWWKREKSIKTIQNEISRLRVFCSMLGKPGMVARLEKYLPDVDQKSLRTQTTALTSKSWAARGIDMTEKFREIDCNDIQLGMMLRMELAFGLRREEVLKCNPHVQDCGTYFQILPGMGKGGRPRTIPVASSAQRELLDYVKSRSPKNKVLGWEYTASGALSTLKSNLKRYEYLMARMQFTKAEIGVTGHGLRAQFAENHTLLLGLIPPTMSDCSGQSDIAEIAVARTKVAQALGHNRAEITGAYVGRFDKAQKGNIGEMAPIIRAGFALIQNTGGEVSDPHRLQDCIEMCACLARAGVMATFGQIQEMWCRHAKRHGVDWISPEGEVLVAFEAQARLILRDVAGGSVL